MNSLFTYATAQLLRALPRQRMNRAAGRLADHAWNDRVGRAVVGAYSRAYDVELHECADAGPWSSFDSFFTRRLRDGARPVDPRPHVLVSPADGRLESLGHVDGAASTFQVKGHPYRVDELLGDRADAQRYEGGAGCVIYLSPRDYHRVHAPADGVVSGVRSMAGEYFPVNAIGVRHFKNLFARNRRVVIHLDTPPESGLGRVAVVMVAAMIVGRVTVTGIPDADVPIGDQVLPAPFTIRRGDELGVFHLGSTVVLFFERNVVKRWLSSEGAVRMGVGLADAQ